MSGLRLAPNWNGYLYYSTGASQCLPSLTLPYRGRTGDTKPGFTWPTDTREFVIEYSKCGKRGRYRKRNYKTYWLLGPPLGVTAPLIMVPAQF
jgi:hypothetical protein